MCRQEVVSPACWSAPRGLRARRVCGAYAIEGSASASAQGRWQTRASLDRRAGQVSSRQTTVPAPSWSDLERGSRTLTPCRPKLRSATRIGTSSERRKAPAKSSRISARSRSPRRLPPQAEATRITSWVRSGAARG